jgi:hypothetical protein
MDDDNDDDDDDDIDADVVDEEDVVVDTDEGESSKIPRAGGVRRERSPISGVLIPLLC